MDRKLLILGGIFGLTAIILGAFGAHGLEKIVDARSIASFETGVRYQFYHALLLLMAGGFLPLPRKRKRIVFYLLLIGVLLFSGSIYLLSTQSVTGVDFTGIALFTPLGGLLLIVSWCILVYSFIKDRSMVITSN